MAADPDLDLLRTWLDASRATAIFTGAGISTESGIPDFRSPGGLWTRLQPIQYQDFLRSAEVRREAWRRKFELDRTFAAARPNRGHVRVAELVARGTAHAVITQNIDNLHQDSGVPEDKVIELHGNMTYARCLECARRYELEPIRHAFEAAGRLPVCGACGGIVKTATISFGQAMPELEMDRAEAATRDADLFLVLGSSLVVYPAAGFPLLAKRLGARLVIINREPTEQDEIADLVLHRPIGDTLDAVVGP